MMVIIRYRPVHSGESRNLAHGKKGGLRPTYSCCWIPASAGMSGERCRNLCCHARIYSGHPEPSLDCRNKSGNDRREAKPSHVRLACLRLASLDKSKSGHNDCLKSNIVSFIMPYTDPVKMRNARYDDNPFLFVFDEIDQALRGGAYYSAVLLAVALPDYCCTLDGIEKTNAKTYKKWFDENAQRYFLFGPDEIYSLRCGVVHGNKLRGGDPNYIRVRYVVLTLPDGGATADENYSSGPGIQMDLISFVRKMVQAASDWYDANKNRDEIKANVDKMVRFRADGDKNMVRGISVIS